MFHIIQVWNFFYMYHKCTLYKIAIVTVSIDAAYIHWMFEFLFRLYSPLLMGEQKNYIQQFAAESFSFLMRKIRDSSKLFHILFSALDSEPDLCQGLGFLCFEMIKGVKKQFHSMTDSVLPVLFSKTGVFQNKSVGVVHCLQWELVCMLTYTTIVLAFLGYK